MDTWALNWNRTHLSVVTDIICIEYEISNWQTFSKIKDIKNKELKVTK